MMLDAQQNQLALDGFRSTAERHLDGRMLFDGGLGWAQRAEGFVFGCCLVRRGGWGCWRRLWLSEADVDCAIQGR